MGYQKYQVSVISKYQVSGSLSQISSKVYFINQNHDMSSTFDHKIKAEVKNQSSEMLLIHTNLK